MKTLVVQEEFITELFLKENSGCEITDDLYAFLSKDFRDYNLICDFSSIDEYQRASLENPIWEFLLDKFDNIFFKNDLKADLDNDSFYSTIGEQNIFLTNLAVKDCQELEEKRGYIYLCSNNISTNWNLYNYCKNGVKLKVTNSKLIPSDQKLDNWEKISKYTHPITSLIIFDKYILKDETSQKIKDNLCVLLEKLLSKRSTNKRVTVTLITDIKDDTEVREKHKFLTDWLSSKRIYNIDLNIIKHFKAFYPKDFEGLHSRYILTNYFHIASNDSFNFFKSSGKINNDADVFFTFCLSNHYCFYKKELEDLKTYVSRLKGNPKSPNPEHRELYYPSKTNNLF